ncbi:MAG TPA: DUF4864 domain-containing protein [Opitutaceae bacterium]|jgi:hypothetical protein|nr:DUF4864 domain-containing protein [Opitutaceae bacterium]
MAARNESCGRGAGVFGTRIWRMLVVTAGLALLTWVAQADDDSGLHYSRAETKQELVAVVTKQLAAFRAGDAAGAYAFTAQGLRQKFSQEQFMTMVGRAYPAVAHNARAEFGLALDDGMQAVLPVDIFTADGRGTGYRYLLVREEGAWRISSVREDKTPPQGSGA